MVGLASLLSPLFPQPLADLLLIVSPSWDLGPNCSTLYRTLLEAPCWASSLVALLLQSNVCKAIYGSPLMVLFGCLKSVPTALCHLTLLAFGALIHNSLPGLTLIALSPIVHSRPPSPLTTLLSSCGSFSLLGFCFPPSWRSSYPFFEVCGLCSPPLSLLACLLLGLCCRFLGAAPLATFFGLFFCFASFFFPCFGLVFFWLPFPGLAPRGSPLFPCVCVRGLWVSDYPYFYKNK